MINSSITFTTMKTIIPYKFFSWNQAITNLFILSIITTIVDSLPPEDPITCISQNLNCTITNSYGSFPDRTICRAAQAIFPTTEAELISAVAKAATQKQKVKVATRYSHSIPKLVCPDGNEGLIISTRYLNHVLNVNVSSMTITVETGVTLKQLIDEAAKANLALPYTPYWLGVTVGGMLGTGAHGSSLWGLGSQVHDYVIELRIVSPDGNSAIVRTLKSGDPELDAAKVSLGVLGVISQVTFSLQPLFKRSVSYVTKSDADFGEEAISFGRKHEFADFMWYPSQKLVVYRFDDRVPSSTSGNGVLDFPGFRATPSLALAAARTSEEKEEFLGDVNGKCVGGKAITFTFQASAYGLTNNGLLFTGYPVVGYQNRIQSSGSCLDSLNDLAIATCGWDPRVKSLFYFQNGFSVSLSKVKNFIEDVQKLVELEPKSLCGLDLYNGILIRYVTASSAYLGKEEDALDFDITYYRSHDPLTPRLFEDILEEIEQIAVFKYGALPHWGKNRNVAFQGAIGKYKNASDFVRVKEIYDPLGLFSSDWTDQVLGLKDGLSIVKEGCGLEGLCICSEDVHCAPDKGYFCRSGKVYADARVCTKITV